MKAILITISGHMVWKFFHDSESDRWIAVSDTLQLTVEGKTHAEMRQMIDETTGLLLADLYESGELNTFLDDRGFRPTSMPTPSPQQRIQFDVPFELIRQATDDSARCNKDQPDYQREAFDNPGNCTSTL